MSDPRHITSVIVGTTTTAAGSFTLADVQTFLGLAAAVCGIILTVATFVWRWREHGERMRTKENKDEVEANDPTDKCN